MKVTYDKKAGAIYIALTDIPNGGVAFTEELVADTVMVDRASDGSVCGVEILMVESIEEL